MSDFEDPREDDTANTAAREPSAPASAAASVAGGSAAAGPVNPRKRKKSSRASVNCTLPFYFQVVTQPCVLSCYAALLPPTPPLLPESRC